MRFETVLVLLLAVMAVRAFKTMKEVDPYDGGIDTSAEPLSDGETDGIEDNLSTIPGLDFCSESNELVSRFS
jgi:hypothetical protein